MTKKTFKVWGMHCSSCAMTIEWELEDAGVKAKCSYAQQVVEVEYDSQKVSDEKIKEVVKKAGYQVDIV